MSEIDDALLHSGRLASVCEVGFLLKIAVFTGSGSGGGGGLSWTVGGGPAGRLVLRLSPGLLVTDGLVTPLDGLLPGC